MKISDGEARAIVKSKTGLADAELCYTTSTGPWQKRKWQMEPALTEDGKILATIPPERPLVCFMSMTDSRGLKVSTQHEELK